MINLIFPSSIFFLIFTMIEILIYFIQGYQASLISITLSLLVSLVFWVNIEIIKLQLSRLSIKSVEVSFGLLVSLIVSTSLIGNILVSLHFKEYLTFEMLYYFLGDTETFFGLLKDYLFNPLVLVSFIGLNFLIYKCLDLKSTFLKDLKLSRSCILIILLSFIGLYSVNKQTWRSDYSNTGIISSTFVSFKRGLKRAGKQNFLRRSKRSELVTSKIEDPYNIIVIYHESWGKDSTALYNGNTGIMTNLENFYQRHQDSFVKFKYAYTNSTATDLSVPSIMTGLFPTRSNEDFHKVPFIWNWAKSFGLDTFLVSSQRFEWSRFNQYFLSSPPDKFFVAENLDVPIVHDIGIDDHYSAKKFSELIKSQDKTRPFLGIYNSNGMHVPFQKSSEFYTPNVELGAYEKSASIVDHAFKDIIDTLEEQKVLDNTFIIITSDHGESDHQEHYPPRIYSHYEEFINIPFLVKVPSRWKAKFPQKFSNLQANVTNNISNVDILPTMINILSPSNKEGLKNGNVRGKLDGRSLFSELDNSRIIKVTSTNDFRSWAQEGFAIIRGDLRYVFSNKEGSRVFNIRTDTNQKKPLENSDISRSFESIISSDKHFSRMYNSQKVIK